MIGLKRMKKGNIRDFLNFLLEIIPTVREREKLICSGPQQDTLQISKSISTAATSVTRPKFESVQLRGRILNATCVTAPCFPFLVWLVCAVLLPHRTLDSTGRAGELEGARLPSGYSQERGNWVARLLEIFQLSEPLSR